MLENGKIIEEGSHNELKGLNGKNAEKSHVKNNYYEKGGGKDEYRFNNKNII